MTVATPIVPVTEPELLDMAEVRVDPAWALRIPPTLALRRLVLPFACLDDRVHVACADPHDTAALEAVERFVARQKNSFGGFTHNNLIKFLANTFVSC